MAAMILATKCASESVKMLMKDISNMTKTCTETCFDIKKNITVLGSYMDINECDCTIFFESTKRAERLWLATEKLSLRFTLHSLQSIYELSSEVNYHKNAGHVLCFTKDFEEDEALRQVKSMFEKTFVPAAGAAVERALCFYHADGIIYMRNYIIDGMAEVGPRMEMELDKILEGCFKGATLYNRNNE